MAARQGSLLRRMAMFSLESLSEFARIATKSHETLMDADREGMQECL